MGQVPGRRRERGADVLPDLAELELMPDRRVGALPKASILVTPFRTRRSEEGLASLNGRCPGSCAGQDQHQPKEDESFGGRQRPRSTHVDNPLLCPTQGKIS